jgi:tRNA nucleotidyltransferase/poly(A) polymerase
MLEPATLKLLESIFRTGQTLGVRTFLVGGFVRDLLLSLETFDRDIDIVVDGDGQPLARRLSEVLGGELKLFPDFFTAKITKLKDFGTVDEVDIASARAESYPSPGKLPVVTISRIEEDLKRRDFTVNAMALGLEEFLAAHARSENLPHSIRSSILDHFSGMRDLYEGRIRVLHKNSFIDDPTRIFRALRYVTRLDGSLDPETEGLMSMAISSGALGTISMSRRLTEIRKICAEARVTETLESLLNFRVLDTTPIFPEDQEDLVIERVRCLDMTGLRISAELKAETCFHIFHEADRAGSAGFLHLWGIGRKRLRAMTTRISRADSGENPKSMTDEELVLALVFHAKSPQSREMQAVARARNLL